MSKKSNHNYHEHKDVKADTLKRRPMIPLYKNNSDSNKAMINDVADISDSTRVKQLRKYQK